MLIVRMHSRVEPKEISVRSLGLRKVIFMNNGTMPLMLNYDTSDGIARSSANTIQFNPHALGGIGDFLYICRDNAK